MQRPPASAKGVLSYLRDMIKLCRNLHRSDMERVYEEAWEFAAIHIYGPLPPRKDVQSVYTQWAPAEPQKAKPRWMVEKFSKPLRRVVARDGDDEILECGHRYWWPEKFPGPRAKRRRCAECAKTLATAEYSQQSQDAGGAFHGRLVPSSKKPTPRRAAVRA